MVVHVDSNHRGALSREHLVSFSTDDSRVTLHMFVPDDIISRYPVGAAFNLSLTALGTPVQPEHPAGNMERHSSDR